MTDKPKKVRLMHFADEEPNDEPHPECALCAELGCVPAKETNAEELRAD